MKRFLLGVAVIAIVAGCIGTPEEKAAKRDLAVQFAASRIVAFNDAGIDPVQLDAKQLLILDTLCLTALFGGIEAGLDADTMQMLAETCALIQKAAAPAPLTAPAPGEKPATE